jgi:hypothetical protein
MTDCDNASCVCSHWLLVSLKNAASRASSSVAGGAGAEEGCGDDDVSATTSARSQDQIHSDLPLRRHPSYQTGQSYVPFP